VGGKGRRRQQWKGQHVGRGVDAHVLAIQLGEAGIVGEDDPD
jgi:hypothetical protein